MKVSTIKKKSRHILATKYKKLNIDRRILLIFLFGLILAILYKQVIFVALFSAINAFLLSIERKTGVSQDMEFSTFSAVLFTMAYSLQWGLFMSVFTKFVSNIYNSQFRIDHLFMVAGYAMAAFAAHWFGDTLGVMWTGLIATVIVNIYIWFVSKYITMLSNFEIVMYGGSNIIFNFLLFSIIAELVLAVMR